VSSLLSFDLETHLIQPGLLAPPVVCWSAAWRGDDKMILSKLCAETDFSGPHSEATLDFEGVFNPKQIFVGANIAYDWCCVLAVRPDLLPLIWKAYEEERVFDVLIAGTLDAIYDGRLREGELFAKDGTKIQKGRYSLETVVKDYLGRGDAKRNDRWRKSYALLEHLPISEWPEDARQYPIDDAVNTLEASEMQIKVCNNLHDLPRQAHAAFCAHLGAIWGLRTDPERVKAFKAEVDEHLKVTQAYGVEHGLMKPKWKGRKPNKYIDGYSKDTKVIKERVFKAYDGLPPTTDGGDVSMSRETLEDSGDPVLEKFAEGSKWEKLKTYADTLAATTGLPMNVVCNILLSTGRASYEGLIQLMPRKGGVRECFVPRPGHVWSSVDYAAVEMSTLAQVCLWTVGYSTLADAINDGKDPHCILGGDLVGITYEEFLARKKEFADNVRFGAKAGNFGYAGMMGEAAFVVAQKKQGFSVCKWLDKSSVCGSEKVRVWKRDLDAPLCKRCCEVAAIIRPAYVNRWTEIKPYWNWVQANLGHTGQLEQFVSKRIRGGLSGPAGANTLFQGLAADGAKSALRAMTKEMYLDRQSPLFGSRLMIFAHDETIIEIPEEKAHEAAHRQAEIMVEHMHKYTPDVKIKAEPALMRRWHKQAEAVYSNGRLVPWEPEVAKAA
jgi:DNA polymerase I